jgi:hypothetical protein
VKTTWRICASRPLDVSLQNLRLELMFPADDATAKWLARNCGAQ